MSGESQYQAYLLGRNSIAIRKEGRQQALEVYFTKTALDELGCSLRMLIAGLTGREDMERFMNLILNNPDYKWIRVKNRFAVYTAAEMMPETPIFDEIYTDSIDVLLEEEKPDPEIPIIDTESVPLKIARRKRDSSTVLLRSELFDD